jgi:hypothetical protein
MQHLTMFKSSGFVRTRRQQDTGSSVITVVVTVAVVVIMMLVGNTVSAFLPLGNTMQPLQLSFVRSFNEHILPAQPALPFILFSQKSSTSSDDDDDVYYQVDPMSDDFLVWLKERGCEADEGVVEIGISAATQRRGLYATRDITKGDYVFAIPFDSALIIEEEESSDAERGYKFLQLKTELQSSSTFERDWRPYFDILPTLSNNCSPTPDFWSQKDIQKLEMPPMMEMVLERKQSIETLAREKGISLEELQFATWLVNSRGITLVDNQDNEEIDDEMMSEYLHQDEDDENDNLVATTCVMIPLLDMINHSSKDCNTYLSVLGDDGEDDDGELFYAVVARRDIKAGEELLISYGNQEDTSLELLLHYGFVPDDNPYDVDFLAWSNANENEMTSYWSTGLQHDKEQLHLVEATPSPNSAIEETALRFRIRMKEAYEEYKTLVENGFA